MKDIAPMGIDAGREVKITLFALAASALWSFRGPLVMIREWNEILKKIEQGKLVSAPSLSEMMGTALFGFYITALGLAALAVWHYVYHRRGARADYLMGRLPDRLELHVRCLAIPLVGIVISLAAAGIMFLIHRGSYLYFQNRAFTEAIKEGLL